VYSLTIPGFNSGNAFNVYCDFTMDGGLGYAIVFNRRFVTYQAGPSAAEMTATGFSGTPGIANDFSLAPTTIFAAYGATRMAVYATIGQSSAGGVQSGSTYRWVRFIMSATQMVNCWNGNQAQPFSSGIQWLAAPSGTTGSNANILGAHGPGDGVFQWNEGANINTNTLFEYCPTQRGDPNHYWLVGDGTGASSYYRAMTSLYADSGSLSTRYGGIAIY